MDWDEAISTVLNELRSLFQRYTWYISVVQDDNNLKALHDRVRECVKRRHDWSVLMEECMRKTTKEAATAPTRSGQLAAGWLAWMTAAAALFATGAVTGACSSEPGRAVTTTTMQPPFVPHLETRINLNKSDPDADRTELWVMHKRRSRQRREENSWLSQSEQSGDDNHLSEEEAQKVVRLIRSIARGSHPEWRSASDFVERATVADVLKIIGPTSTPYSKYLGALQIPFSMDTNFTGYNDTPIHIQREMRAIASEMIQKLEVYSVKRQLNE